MCQIGHKNSSQVLLKLSSVVFVRFALGALLECRMYSSSDSGLVVIGFTVSLYVIRSEHERHSPQCPFVKGEFTQNVPLSGMSLLRICVSGQ